MKSTAPASAKTTLSWAAAWRSSDEAGADDEPIVLGIARGGQIAHGGERGFEARNRAKTGNQPENPGLLALAIGGKAKADTYLLAEGAVSDEQQ